MRSSITKKKWCTFTAACDTASIIDTCYEARIDGEVERVLDALGLDNHPRFLLGRP